jgi:hypothetical protein
MAHRRVALVTALIAGGKIRLRAADMEPNSERASSAAC